MKPREFVLVMPKGYDSKNFDSDEGSIFINPDYKDFRHWKEYKDIWEVIHVREIETDIEVDT